MMADVHDMESLGENFIRQNSGDTITSVRLLNFKIFITLIT